MPLQLPQLSDSRIDIFSACIWFSSDIAQQLSAANQDEQFESKYSNESDEYFIQAYSGKDEDGEAHLHINIANPGYFGKRPPSAEDPLDRLTSHIERFNGYSARRVTLRGVCDVDKSELPSPSLGPSLLGNRAKSPTGEFLTLCEATFSISGEPFDSLEWRLLRSSKDGPEKYRATLVACFSDYEIQNDMLTAGVDTLCDGVRRFILEQSGT